MKIVQCVNPQYVYNKYTGEKLYVPCGKCDACRRGHNSIWIQRLEQEFQCWKYAAFVTLTYADEYLHRFHYRPTDNSLLDGDSGEYLSIPDSFNYKDKRFLFKREVYAVNKIDCQLFIKRLRYYIHQLHLNPVNYKKYGKQTEIIRYFLVAEYGPTTLRPHYHCIFWFNSQLTAANFEALLRKTWKLGNCDFSFCSSSSASARYVAQYLNCVTSLPKVYQFEALKPFSLCSRHPAIGTLQIKQSEAFEIFDTCSPVRTIYDRAHNEFVDVPIWRSLQDSLFPLVTGFNYLPHHARIAIYGLYNHYAVSTFADFKAECLKLASLFYSKSELPCNNTCVDYVSELVSRCSRSGKDYSLRRLYIVSKHVCLQSAVFGISVADYVTHIETYYSNKEYYKLVKWFEFQEEFSRNYDISAVLYADRDYLHRCISRVSVRFGQVEFADIDKLIFDGFSVLPDYGRVASSNPLLFDSSYSQFIIELDYFISRSTKSKKKNDYLNAHPEYRNFY